MLQLTNSSCRYLMLTSGYFNSRAHVKRYLHICCKRKSCTTKSVQKADAGQLLHPIQQAHLRANVKSSLHSKMLPIKSFELRKTEQMSGPLQPTPNHVSYGGQFDIDDFFSETLTNHDSSIESASDSARSSEFAISPDFRIWEPTGMTTNSCNVHLHLTMNIKRDKWKYFFANFCTAHYRRVAIHENHHAILFRRFQMAAIPPQSNKSFKFRVISYNVLAQYLLECHPYLYTGCRPVNLKWKNRSARLYNEILKLAPDIFCLQEVQASHLYSFFYKFEQIGYFGVFKQKTGRQHDGCAIYFKQSLFEMQDTVCVEYFQPELPILNRDNIGVMVKLIPRHSPKTPFVVVTTHLLYNPKRTDVRLAQVQLLLAEIDRFAYFNNGKESGYLPIILTGDLNSTPDSAVVNLLDTGHVSGTSIKDNSDWKKIGVTDNCQHLSVYLNRSKGLATEFSMTKIYNSEYRSSLPEPHVDYTAYDSEQRYSEMFNSGAIGHSFKLRSVYEKVKPDGKLEATTFQDYWITVDYIYFSCCSKLKLVERLRLPTDEECLALGTLPNNVYASDHLALGATFELRPV